MITNKKFYLRLFWSAFCLSAFTFGGGYVIVTMMRKKFVQEYGWIEENEMLDLVAISQSAPGAIAINASILIGYRLAGFLGAILTILGTVLPPFIVISIISFFYTAVRNNVYVNNVMLGMQAGIAAVILDVVIDLALGVIKEKNYIFIAVMILAFIATFFFNVNVVFIILICGFLGAAITYYKEKYGKEQQS